MSNRPSTVPAWVPPVVFAAVTLLLFREFFLFGTSMLGLDSIALSYFARNFYTEFVQLAHRMPYWNPLLFGGLPFVEGMHGDIFYPPSLAMFFLDARAMWGWKMALHVFAAGVFTYLWLRRGLKLDRLPAMVGGLIYMMGADLVSLVLPGGDGKLFVSALAPLLFWLAERAVAGRRLADYATFALGLALTLFTSHMQAAYYCVWGVSLYFMFRVWQQWRADGSVALAARAVGLFAVAGVLGVAAAAVQFLPPLEYLQEHSHRVDRAEERGYDWSSTYSLNAEEVMALVVPEFVGEIAQSSDTRPAGGYWGKNGLKLNSEYAGLVPLLLLAGLLTRRRTAQVWFFVGLALLTVTYALASSTPFGRLFYLIPGVDLFRAWSIIIFVYGLSVATLAAIAAQQMHDWLIAERPRPDMSKRKKSGHREGVAGRASDPDAVRRTLWITSAVFGTLALLASAGVVTSVWTELFFRDMPERNASILAANAGYITAGFWMAFGLAVAVAGAWHLAVAGTLSARAFLIVLAVLAALDLYRVDRPFVKHTAMLNEQIEGSTMFVPDPLIRTLQQLRDEGGVFRVADLGPMLGGGMAYGSNELATHGIEQLAGHHGNEIGRYRNLIGGESAINLMTSNLRLADVTNTQYLLLPGRFTDPRLEEVTVSGPTVLYRNVTALPRAYLVGSTEIVPGDGAIDRVLAEDFDARTTVVLDAPVPAGAAPVTGATGTVEWVDRQVDRMTLRVDASAPALLVVLDNHHPAWHASVDGEETAVLRANHTFRAVAVPAGMHTVELWYEPDALRSGALISLLVLGLLLGVVLAGAVRERQAREVAV